MFKECDNDEKGDVNSNDDHDRNDIDDMRMGVVMR